GAAGGGPRARRHGAHHPVDVSCVGGVGVGVGLVGGGLALGVGVRGGPAIGVGLGVFGVGVRVGLGARRRTGERRTGRLADASAGSSGTSGSGG
uniref:hypothetical protein n=1 Tax=Piscicoccus intestinalis TaxID=746033 RepID=UPI000838C604